MGRTGRKAPPSSDSEREMFDLDVSGQSDDDDGVQAAPPKASSSQPKKDKGKGKEKAVEKEETDSNSEISFAETQSFEVEKQSPEIKEEKESKKEIEEDTLVETFHEILEGHTAGVECLLSWNRKLFSGGYSFLIKLLIVNRWI